MILPVLTALIACPSLCDKITIGVVALTAIGTPRFHVALKVVPSELTVVESDIMPLMLTFAVKPEIDKPIPTSWISVDDVFEIEVTVGILVSPVVCSKLQSEGVFEAHEYIVAPSLA